MLSLPGLEFRYRPRKRKPHYPEPVADFTHRSGVFNDPLYFRWVPTCVAPFDLISLDALSIKSPLVALPKECHNDR